MGIQSVPLPPRVRYASRPVEPKGPQAPEATIIKKCQRQIHDARLNPLPSEAQELKVKILETHPIRTSRFSLSHLKRIAIPPVEVPANLSGTKVTSSTVSGKRVPFTRDMWENRKRKTMQRHLDCIHEHVKY